MSVDFGRESDHWPSGRPELLLQQGLDGFDALWELDLSPIEAENEERGGRSGVALLELADGSRLFLKRQIGHETRENRFPFRRIPTFQREYRAIRSFQAAGFSVPEALYFGRRGSRAILLTRELEAAGDLDEVTARQSPEQRKATLLLLARELARLHGLGLKHGSLYPKHIFVLQESGEGIGFIDLEKANRSRLVGRARQRDLDALNRRARHFSAWERRHFLLAYCAEAGLPALALWRRLREKAERRSRR